MSAGNEPDRRGSQRGARQEGGRGRRQGNGQTNRQGTQRRGGADRRPGRVSASRLVAYDVLRDVVDRDAYANLALPARIREAGLDERDAALATELAAGTLRMRGRYDRIIELASGRELAQIDDRTLNVLRLGAHQLLGMRVASHAAVNESVELQRRVANQNAAGFVNGVLRAIGRADNAEWDDRIDAEAARPDDALAARASHPVWVLRALRDALKAEGREDELPELLAADNTPPRVSLAVLPGAGEEPSALAAEFDALAAAGPSPLGVELAGGDPMRAIRAADAPEGLIRVQDQGSQLAALALTRARPAAAGERWLDLCAGPGGKTAVLGAEAIASGATVRANEVSDHRADLVDRAVEGVADAVTVVSHDGRDDAAFGGSAETFDRILVDAPCSGLGALRRRPEARWRKRPGDLPELTELQGQLLDAAAEHLAPGGLLAYVTCSPHLAETRVTVDRFLARTPGLREVSAKAAIAEVARGEIDLAGDQLSAQLWPHRHGTDAMFVALFERA
ncbi:rRNA small subunit methyltransferase B [Leucobacter sp. CSA2]|uniref:rRNA small subunit methyltransferase B n=1 Tax=Leucobacter edaphi TaxID=2796472 RepID=A0A934QB75_9MICO|nr:rRNA small subunit methyltransferase B [Leucobacter edaphi]